MSTSATDTAGAYATQNVPTATPVTTAGELRAALARTERFDSAAEIVVLDRESLVGIARLEDVLAAPAATSVSEILDPDPPIVGPGTNQRAAAWTAVEHGEGSLVVVDDSGRFAGLVPPWRLLGVLLREHDADAALLGGYLHETEVARSAMVEPIPARFVHRMPWLVIGLVVAMLAAVMVSAFEKRLSEEVALAFFIPGIVYVAAAVGTQTETIIVRGLSAEAPLRFFAFREAVTGIAVGTSLAVLAYPFALAIAGSSVALTVALSIAVATSIATIIAMGLPWLLWRLGGDPAFGTGPLATVVQDVLSLLVYFGFAVILI